MRIKKIIKISLIILLSVILLTLISSMIFVFFTIKPVKDLELNLYDNKLSSVSFFDSNNDIIEYNNDYKHYTPISSIKNDTIQAFVSIEDKDFFKHNGLNLKRIIGATINNITNQSLKEGASTITQQLIKNKYLSNEKTFDRKIKEAYLAIKLENKYDKLEILESYLNTIYFGNGAYGIGEASKMYFNKEVNKLTLNESCVLAGIIKSPNYYSPITNYENCMKRKNLILSELLEDGYIEKDMYDKLSSIDVEINFADNYNQDNTYLDFAINEACQILNKSAREIQYSNYKIYTYQDSSKQKILDSVINDKSNYEKNNFGNVADSLGIIIDNSDYRVQAISSRSKYNLVNMKRQPGSLIKPIFCYAPAIEEGVVHSCSHILDEPIDFNGYTPSNVGNKYYGYVSVKDSLSKSLNIPAIKICEKVGLNKCKEYAKKCGINFDINDNGYALALGGMTYGVTLKEITDAYSALSNDGMYAESALISKIVDNNGITIYNRQLSEIKVFNTDTSYIMSDTLHHSTHSGTSKRLNNFHFDVAGKTGTVAYKNTNYNTDAYSLAYTTENTVAIWLGNYTMNENYNLLGSNNGGTYATSMIKDVFTNIYKDNHPRNFEKPDTVSLCPIDSKTLQEEHIVVLGNNIPERYQTIELFSNRYIPDTQSNKFGEIEPFDITVTSNKNSCILKLDVHDYIEYDIYKNGNKIYTIKNRNEHYTYIDSDIKFNTEYDYYIIARSNHSDAIYKTNTHKIFMNKDYNELLGNISNDSWIFEKKI